MSMENREEKFLRAAMQLGIYYAYLAQALRSVINPEGPSELPEAVLTRELDQIRSGLEAVLANNRAVQESVAQIDRKVTQIRRAAAQETTWGEAVKEAKRILPEIETRARTVSDLVALMRGF
ncbi:MAG TPA: hypothetical protein VFA47_02145 [Candidatus Manganitrophaceae bacterium]|nr:hypothetical protein [Candidatus Manganitrophaceae bacterium]